MRTVAVVAVVAALGACSGGVGKLTRVFAGETTAAHPAYEPPASSIGSYLAARLARHEKDTDAAAGYFSKALASDPDNVDLLRQTYLAMHAGGRMEEATKLARRIIELRPKESVAGLTLAAQAFRDGDYGTALARIEALPRQGYNALLGPMLKAWAKVGQGRFAEAHENLESLGKTEAFAAFREFHGALIDDLAGNREAAEKSYKFMVGSQPGGSFRVVAAFGAFYERGGRIEDARRLYADYQAARPDSVWFEPYLTRIDSGETPERMVRNARDGAAESLFGISSSLFQENAFEPALLYTRLAIFLRPDFDAAYLLLGEIHAIQGRQTTAVEAYGAVSPASPLHWAARLKAAAALDEVDRVDEAVTELRRMAEERPERSGALITLGDLLRSRDRWGEAVDAYDAALARIEDFERRHWRPFYARGIALERSKNWPRAERDFLQALDLEPDQPFVLNYLGYSWVDKGINLDRALRMIERAVDLRPHDGYIVDSLGWALYRMGRFEDAASQLERAVEMRPDDPTINDHLGDAYWRVGRRNEARFQWRRALLLEPDDEEIIADIEQKLRRGLMPDTVADGGS